MDERRDIPPPRESGPRLPLVAANTSLSPLQEAYADYTSHAIKCAACRDVDRKCTKVEDLLRAYRAVEDDTFRQLESDPSGK